MLKNYFKIALRVLLRNKFYSIINIFGLAVGLASFILIAIYIQDELSYDKQHSMGKNIYRVIEKIDNAEGQGENSSSNPFPVGPSLQNDYPHLIEQQVRFFNFQDEKHTLQVGDKKYNEKYTFFADSNVLNLFDFPLQSGDREKVLSNPNSIVLTKELAQKYFGNEDPIGKLLKFDGVIDLLVTGIFGDLPQQTHLKFSALISFSTLRQMVGPDLQIKNWI